MANSVEIMIPDGAEGDHHRDRHLQTRCAELNPLPEPH